MHGPWRVIVVFTAFVCSLPLARAQQTEAPAAPAQRAAGNGIPTPEQLEPGVNTTPSAPGGPAVESPATPARPRRSAGPEASADARAPKSTTSGPASRKGPDRLQLDATEITGNRELPKVLYIVPWKRSDLGDLTGKPVNSLLDEVLQPLDRDVFQRENRYYGGLKPPVPAPKGSAPQTPESKP